MATGTVNADEGYSALMGVMYIFNLIVGTGALAMPAAFSGAGWLLSLLILLALAFMSFLTVTFVTEAMAAANAMVHSYTVRQIKRVMVDDDRNQNNKILLVEQILTDEVISSSLENEKVPLLLSNSVDSVTESSAAEYFNITERIEMGKMASLFFNKVGVNLFYICIAVYLYGDLAIYAAAVSKSLRDVTCNFVPGEGDCNVTINNSVKCWTVSANITRNDAYMIYLVVFMLTLGPFAFFNVQKTKYLQIFTTIMRWLAFGTMIILAAIALVQGKAKGNPEVAHLGGMPNLFGVCVYSFMCHHSLPSLITPIRNKSRLLHLLIIDYTLILGFYALLSFTGIFTFDHLQDIYTLNFEPQKCNGTDPESEIITHIPVIQYFLALFPVFTLSTNFPIIAITIRNNLKSIFLKDGKQYNFFLSHMLFPLAAIIPPVGIAFITEDLTYLVGITGSYAGAVIQYIVPALLVYYSRKDTLSSLGLGVRNPYASPFKSTVWIWFVLLWAVTCIIFVTVNHIINSTNKHII